MKEGQCGKVQHAFTTGSGGESDTMSPAHTELRSAMFVASERASMWNATPDVAMVNACFLGKLDTPINSKSLRSHLPCKDRIQYASWHIGTKCDLLRMQTL